MEALMKHVLISCWIRGESQITNKLQNPYNMLLKIKLGLQMTYGCSYETPAASSYLTLTFC